MAFVPALNALDLNPVLASDPPPDELPSVGERRARPPIKDLARYVGWREVRAVRFCAETLHRVGDKVRRNDAAEKPFAAVGLDAHDPRGAGQPVPYRQDGAGDQVQIAINELRRFLDGLVPQTLRLVPVFDLPPLPLIYEPVELWRRHKLRTKPVDLPVAPFDVSFRRRLVRRRRDGKNLAASVDRVEQRLAISAEFDL
ncbi:MAG: hypothetical protein IPK75_18925 [Acidobacteria bacterium]|nr:hypothetical protein [Acidobacteriota bacterium]